MHSTTRRTPRLVGLAAAAALIMSACATTGATVGSGVGDAWFEWPPYVAGHYAPAGARVVHLPVAFQRGASQPAQFDPPSGAGSEVAALLEEMNAYLGLLELTAGAAPRLPAGTPPDVRFGCERLPDDECRDADPRMPHRLAVGRPSGTWIADAAAVLDEEGADLLLVLTLEIGNYLPRQRNLRGDKEVLLGRDHAQHVRWLTALDRPVSVLQLTGALVDRDGRAVRIAAEGLTARTTSVIAGGFGLHALITDDDVANVRGARRTELPGQPLTWQMALSGIVAELTGRVPTARH
jgi:hypothetical protein